MVKKLFTVEIEHDDDVHHSSELLRDMISNAVLVAIPHFGMIAPTVDVQIGDAVPKVVISVRDGVALVDGVAGDVDVVVADFDGYYALSADRIDHDLTFSRFTGTQAEIDAVLEAARETLAEGPIEDEPTP